MEVSHWNIINKSIAESMDYQTYQDAFVALVESGRSSGPNQETMYVEYTKLNHHRLKRLDKTAQITEEFSHALRKLSTPQTWLVITESWCGDAVQALPFFNKIAIASPHITLKIVLRDEHTELIDLFLTHGGRSIPKMIIIDEAEPSVLGEWGPRPAPAQAMYKDFRTQPEGREYKDVQMDLQKWYLQDKGVTMQKELTQIIEKNGN